MESIDDIIKQYPGLQELSARFGSLKSINLSNNSLLKLLIISGDYKTEIKGLSSLPGLEFLGITGTLEEFNPSLHPELVRLSIKGHKMNTIDVSNNTKLTALFLQSNNLKEISLNSNVNLESLYILNNDLVTIDLSNNKEIEYLNLYANYIEELDITKQEKLKYLDVSSTFLRKLTAPISLDYLEEIHLEKARFLDEEELLDAVFKGQENNSKQNGKIKFNEFAVILDRQIVELQKLKEEYSWNINIPE
ncbi:hypothetical protein [uncultured Maribacter sp.]|uniref:hypothetical protein n=1 Tax=uncultured Maribacter sp. TaxID=431308 RepID=UPI0026353CBA|nr:hypothetical protein [uncultured Maribacter sp.]